VLDVTTYDERAGLINPVRPEDRDAIQRLVRAKLVTAAQESGILVHADRSADRVLTELLARDGYSVKIVRPMVVDKPRG
jgi:DNA-binding FadR family transcriptional regulator